MAEIVNLRRVRKAKAKAKSASEANANRTKHGLAKSVRAIAEAREQHDKRSLEGKKLDSD